MFTETTAALDLIESTANGCLEALRMHASRGKVGLTLMTDRIIWRVRRREVAWVSSHDCREQSPGVAMPHSVRQGLKYSVVRDTRVPRRGGRRLRAPVRLRERGTVSIFRPSPASPPLRGREGKCKRRHEHRFRQFYLAYRDRIPHPLGGELDPSVAPSIILRPAGGESLPMFHPNLS
jgi:hypothetical protein